jgi:hypothetical protein
VLRHAHVIEPRRQPIIGTIARLDLFAHTAAERPRVLRAPRLDPIAPVVTLGEDEGQPDDPHSAETHSRPIAVGREVGVDQLVHAHLLELRDEDRDSVYSLGLDCDLFAHPTS